VAATDRQQSNATNDEYSTEARKRKRQPTGNQLPSFLPGFGSTVVLQTDTVPVTAISRDGRAVCAVNNA